MNVDEVMAELKEYGVENTVKIYRNHGAKGELFGVKIGDMKKILKKTKKDHELAKQLYDTGNLDAMYLAALMADKKKTDRALLDKWIQSTGWYLVANYGVAALAAEAGLGWEAGLDWIDAENPQVAAAGWAALNHHVSLTKDENLDLAKLEELLDRASREIHEAPNRVRYSMNAYIIGVGSFVAPLAEKARRVAEKVGKVEVYLGKTNCKVPHAPDYLKKMADSGRIGKKRKYARC